MITLWWTVGCTRSTPEAAPTATPDGPTTGVTTSTGGPTIPPAEPPLAVTFAAAPGNPLAASALVTAARDTTVAVSYGVAGAFDRTTPEVALAAGETREIPVLGLYSEKWELAVVADGVRDGQSWSITTERPEGLNFAPVTSDTKFPVEQAICAAREAQRPAYVCTDREGRATLYVPLPDAAMFVRPLSDGTFVAHPDGPPDLVRFDALGRVLDRFGLDDLVGATTYPHDRIDEHEVIEITEGQWAGAWAVLTATEEAGRTGAGIVVFDPDTREVLWDWSAHGAAGDSVSIDPVLLPYSRQGILDEGYDWLHANALLHGSDAGGEFFWMSLRHQDWIIKIEAPSGAIAWRLGFEGDFTLVDDLDSASPAVAPDADWFFHQHAPEVRRRADGRLDVLVFDNGNARPGAPGENSRVIELTIDEEAREAQLVFGHGGFYSPAAGDADRLPDDSGVLYTKAVIAPYIAQVGFDGVEVWRQSFTGEGELYRSEYYPSLYETAPQPP